MCVLQADEPGVGLVDVIQGPDQPPQLLDGERSVRLVDNRPGTHARKLGTHGCNITQCATDVQTETI